MDEQEQKNKTVEDVIEQGVQLPKEFGWDGNYALTEEDIRNLSRIFENTSDFYLLRKALGVLTAGEKGLFLPSTTFTSQREYDIHRIADEKIRRGMLLLFMKIEEYKKGDYKKQPSEVKNKNL